MPRPASRNRPHSGVPPVVQLQLGLSTLPAQRHRSPAGQIGDQAIAEPFRSTPAKVDLVQPAADTQPLQPVPAGAERAADVAQAKDDASRLRTFTSVVLVISLAGVSAGARRAHRVDAPVIGLRALALRRGMERGRSSARR